jgi:DNA-directed RNA polymerase subunit RPC12/RpoP
MKNNVFSNNMNASLSYDNDLRFFKVIVGGNIWTSFDPDQIKGLGTDQVGALMKKGRLSVMAKWPNGDEFTFVFTLPNKQMADSARANIDAIVVYAQGFNSALRLLRTRERVPASEIAALLGTEQDSSGRGVREFVEWAISSGQVEGVYDGTQFVSKIALQRETIHYDIVSKFEVNASGALVITCPKCGAAIPLETKEANQKCRYCGSPIMIPRKILDMV